MDKTISVQLKCNFCQSNDIKIIDDVNAECVLCGESNDLNAIRNIAKQKGHKMAEEYAQKIMKDELNKMSRKLTFKVTL